VEEIRFQFFDGIGFDPEVASRGARREQFRVTICGELDNGPYLARGRGRQFGTKVGTVCSKLFDGLKEVPCYRRSGLACR